MDLGHTTSLPPALLQRRSTIGFWQSCFAAFGSSFCPPPMEPNYNMMYPRAKFGTTVLSSFGTSRKYFPLTCPPKDRCTNFPYFCSSSSLFGVGSGMESGKGEQINEKTQSNTNVSIGTWPRVAIIGGGIAGVTAANAIAKRLQRESGSEFSGNIVIFEEDAKGGFRSVNFDVQEQPVWLAATARNANSMVPGAAMHVMSDRYTLLKIMKDTCREWYSEHTEKLQNWLQKEHISYRIMNIDNFDITPPYFAVHLFRCIGPSATWDERATFLTFLRNFLPTSLFSGEAEANERGKYVQQLARANRLLFLEAMNGGLNGTSLSAKMGLCQGFLSLHRTEKSALKSVNECEIFGERSHLMTLEEATQLEPRISNIPIKPLFAVHRIDDYTANSAIFVQDLVHKVKAMGVKYRCGVSGTIQDISMVKHKNKAEVNINRSKDSMSQPLATASYEEPRFKIKTKDGITHDFEYLIIAAGVNSPLFARRLLAGNYCPTYPLRGYSLTIYTNHAQKDINGEIPANLLNKPISIDDMYCSSVGANMARFAGFGELVGYRDKAKDVPSLGPKVLARYGRIIFPESNVTAEMALQCFRPITPDDIPIVGAVRSVPGLYLHTGHGTLGWTLCLATSECVAQELCDNIQGNDDQSTYKLPGNITIDRKPLSPDRFI